MPRAKQDGPLPWFKLWLGPYTRDTRRLSFAQEGAYMRLLTLAQERQEPLPADREELYRLTGARRVSERAAVDHALDQTDIKQHFYRAYNRHFMAHCDDDSSNEINVPDLDKVQQGSLEIDRDIDKDTSKEDATASNDSLVANPFTLYTPWLVKHAGLSERAARSLIGKWRKDMGDANLAIRIAEAQRQGVSDPVAWIQATQRKPTKTLHVPGLGAIAI